MTLLEILDTAVKIGLGALISGASAYFLNSKKLNHELIKEKLDAKKSLVKEAVLNYEKAIASLNIAVNKASHVSDPPMKEELRSIADELIEVKVAFNHSESLARLAGLEELAAGFHLYSGDVNELHGIFISRTKVDFDRASEIVDGFGDHAAQIDPIVARAYDDIYS